MGLLDDFQTFRRGGGGGVEPDAGTGDGRRARIIFPEAAAGEGEGAPGGYANGATGVLGFWRCGRGRG